jgi:hypothetical protein
VPFVHRHAVSPKGFDSHTHEKSDDYIRFAGNAQNMVHNCVI